MPYEVEKTSQLPKVEIDQTLDDSSCQRVLRHSYIDLASCSCVPPIRVLVCSTVYTVVHAKAAVSPRPQTGVRWARSPPLSYSVHVHTLQTDPDWCPIQSFRLGSCSFKEQYTKRLTNDLLLAHELHQEKEIYELVCEVKLEKQAVNADNVRSLSFT